MTRGLVVAALFVTACAHQPPPAPPPAPPPPAKGELFRFKAKPGDETHSKVKLTIEQEQAMAQGGKGAAAGKPVILQFSFGEEERVESVAPDGSMIISARLVDAVGQASSNANQAAVDDMALAFDELKIQFKRQPRGEVVSLGLSGLRKPLTEATARQVLNAIYGAQRGELFPDGPVDLGGTWKTAMPIPSTVGFAGEVHYEYVYARKQDGLSVIGCEGRFAGTRAQGTLQQKLTGKSSAEYHFDLAAGRMMSSNVELMTQDEGAIQGQQPLQLGVRQRLMVEWMVDTSRDKDSSDKESEGK